MCRWVHAREQAVNASTAAEVRYVGVVDAVARIIGAEGVAGLFKGKWVGGVRGCLCMREGLCRRRGG